MTELKREDARRIVHDAGLRATGPRLAVLRALAECAHPQSHSELVVRLGDGDWDQATIYRNLQRLLEVGLVRVASRVGGIARFEVVLGEAEDHVHPHFACKDCALVTCLNDTALNLPADPNWREALMDAELHIVGRCPDCRAQHFETSPANDAQSD